MSSSDSFPPRGVNSPTSRHLEPLRENPDRSRHSHSSSSRIGPPSHSSRNGGGYSRDSYRNNHSRDRPYTQRDSSMNSSRREHDYPSARREHDRNSRTTNSPPQAHYHSGGDRYSSRNRHDSRSTAQIPHETPIKEETRRPRWGSRTVDVFEKLEQIGEGTYGKVYMARNKDTDEVVALKKVRMANEKEGFPITAIREIKILKQLNHPNVVQLKEIVTSKATKEKKGKQAIYMVFEYMDHDLTGLMLSEGRNWKPTPAQIKCYMKQILEGLHYCHANNILHRDIKGSNLLMNNKGEVKLADFGLARPFTDQPGAYTNRVITLWYRPPELLLGLCQYGPTIDTWSAGCILAELLCGRAIFPGKSDVDQLELIFKYCGTPNEENWADVDQQPWWHIFKPQKQIRRSLTEYLREQNPNIPKDALDLVDKLLTLDPKKRATASQALDSEYFWVAPEPAKASQLPKYPSSHEYQAKKKRQASQSSAPESGKKQKGPQGAPLSNSQPSSLKYSGPSSSFRS